MKNYILLFILLFICSCSVKKNVSTDGIKKYSAKKVLRNANKTVKDFKNLQAKARLTINNNGKDRSNNLNIKDCKYQLAPYVQSKNHMYMDSLVAMATASIPFITPLLWVTPL